MPRALAVALAAAATAVAPGAAEASRYAVGLQPGAASQTVSVAIQARTRSRPESLAPIRALIVDAASPRQLRGIRGVSYVHQLRTRRLAVTPTDPLVPRQWYLARSRFYEPWPTLPVLAPVLVAVIDSGVDGGHPDLTGSVLASRSFVGGSATQDALGHGTFVAGLIAAGVNNGVGIAGLSPSAGLLIAKVVGKSRIVSEEAEVKAIRWAVDQGAQVINMSLGGIRDPRDPVRDSYSRLEADAVAYAVRSGALVVAAVGNDDAAPTSPWGFASYPAALPHVIGVSAQARSGATPRFSNRDSVYNDIAAPGEAILSTFPRALTAQFPGCAEQGYSSCGSEEYRAGDGTSFAAPQVSAATAVLLGVRPGLAPDQVSAILERSAVDSSATTGCPACAPGRDSLSGWGRLDVTAAIAALSRPLPPADRLEPNDDAGAAAAVLWGADRRFNATVDFWDDQDDVYAIQLRKGQQVYVGVTAADLKADLSLALWLPGTPSVDDLTKLRFRARLSARPGGREYLTFRATQAGEHYVHVKMSARGATRYRIIVLKG
jgi:hypothetical protein